jgi:hypothetical protein
MPISIVLTDVTEMHGANYCVASWDPKDGRMIRPLPNGTNWTIALLGSHAQKSLSSQKGPHGILGGCATSPTIPNAITQATINTFTAHEPCFSPRPTLF